MSVSFGYPLWSWWGHIICGLLVIPTSVILDSAVVEAFAPSAVISSRYLGWHQNKAVATPLCSTLTETTTAMDPVLLVHQLSKQAIETFGSDTCLTALEALCDMSGRRQALNLEDRMVCHRSMDGSVLSLQRDLLPPETTDNFLDLVAEMERNDWLSTNPDSVDGLPSLHLNLVSQGKPLFPKNTVGTSTTDFQRGIQQLLEIVEMPIYKSLLPNVQRLVKDPELFVSDVFLRRYNETVGRTGISAHYDVFSKVTAVIALDNVAVTGTNGLYTTATSTSNNRGDSFTTSNHAGLRRFIPLSRGDAVIHTWDVLHGVDVEPGIDRTSLIVWFSTKSKNNIKRKSDGADNHNDEDSFIDVIPQWLVHHAALETNHVAQFVLASAIESCSTKQNHHNEQEMRCPHAHDLYLDSASHGNAFGLNRLGGLCEEHGLTEERKIRAMSILNNFHSWKELPFPIRAIMLDDWKTLSRRFWYEGAIRGNPLSQMALADDLMENASGDHDLQTLAACLFGLAAQQGNEIAANSLERVVDFHIADGEGITEREAYLSSPVVQIAIAATGAGLD